MSTKIPLAKYLFSRLKQLGCDSLHGLPGDFNLAALDHVEPAGVLWVGSCNELNAAYAADAYARVRGLGAVLTTFGVGELSAANGIAGSYAELAPVVHIVGTPNRINQENHVFLHHTLGTGDYNVYARMFAEITIAQANLMDITTAPAEIDRVLRTCYIESRPTYIQLPTDMVNEMVDATLLDTPIDLEQHHSDKATEDMAVSVILERLYDAKSPVILIDGAVQRRRLNAAVEKLLEHLPVPVFVAPMGKGIVDESLPHYAGVYAGIGTDPVIKHQIENSDLVLTIGNIKSDLNTAGFSYRFSQLNSIAIHYDHIEVGYAIFQKVFFKSLVPRLAESIDLSKVAQNKITKHILTDPSSDEQYGVDTITHAWMWPRMSSFIEDNDLIVTDTGTSYVGIWQVAMPKNVQVINQLLWSSIGYGVGAAQGAARAAKDNGGRQRTICFQGDGSFHLTAQELSTIIRHDLNCIMFLIENSGYTIERLLHGLEADYNDVPTWQYSKLPDVLTPVNSSKKPKVWDITSRKEFDTLLSNEEFAHGKGLQFVEIHMPKLDAPLTLKEFSKYSGKGISATRAELLA